jgi:hypothetical protein
VDVANSTYAAQTAVPSERSRTEIERTLTRYGATSFAYGWQERNAMIGFVMSGRQIRFLLPLPADTDPEFTRTPTGRPRTATEARKHHEQSVKQRWRALALIVKAKLEAVESGIVTFEDEFAMHMILPDGRRVSEHVLPAVEASYATGQIPPMLALGGGRG